MIEINLLPGARKKTRSSGGGPSFDFRAAFASFTARFKDLWLGVAIGGVAVGLLIVGAMWFFQGRTEAQLTERERIAVQDSAKYDALVKQRQAAEAQRDSIMKQMTVIAAIDGDRFIWPHVLDEISKALPTYTWLNSVIQQGAATTTSADASASGTAPALNLRIVGYTVEAQAITVFMRQLEESAFLEGVTIQSSDLKSVEGKAVTEFTLDVKYSKPDPKLLRTVPLAVAVR